MTRTDVISVLTAMASAGKVTASRLVEEARQPEHPLHDSFTWDDGEAAHQYRLIQARKILTIVHRPEGSRRPIPLLIHIPERRGEGTYELAATVIKRQPDRVTLARDEAIRYLNGAAENIDELDEAIRLYRPSATDRARSERAQRSVRKAQRELAGVGA